MAGLVSQVDSRLLTQAQQKAEASVPEQFRKGYTAIVAAGLKAMFSEKTFPMTKQYLTGVKGLPDVPKVVSHGIVKLLSILFNESQGKLQLEAAGPACIVLMTHALDYVEDVMKLTIDANTLAQTTELTNQGLLHFIKQATKMSDGDFDQIMAGKGKELAASKQQAPPPGAQPMPPQQGVM